MTTDDTAAALEAAIEILGDVCYERGHVHAGGEATGRSIDRDVAENVLRTAITAHVEAEVARRLAAPPGFRDDFDPDIEDAIEDYGIAVWDAYDRRDEQGNAPEDDPRHSAIAALRAAIAADKARAVEFAVDDAAKPLARRMAAEEMLTATMIAYVVSGLRKVGLLRVGPGDIDATTWARLVEAIDESRRVPPDLRDKARPTPDEARRLVDDFAAAVSDFASDGDAAGVGLTRDALLRALGVEA